MLDFTGQKKAVKEIRLRGCTKKPEDINNELEFFSNSITHELRAPLNAIKIFSVILQKNYSNIVETERLEYVNRILTETERMKELIDDLMKLSSISQDELSTDQVDMTAIAKSIQHELHMMEPQRIVEVHIEENLLTFGDRKLLMILLHNLIDNAWKYTSKRQHAKIEFGSLQEHNQTIFFIRDNGVGFDISRAQRLFTPFIRLHSERQFSGSGIGLAIVNRIIKKHNGRIWCTSEINNGSTFFFTLQKPTSNME